MDPSDFPLRRSSDALDPLRRYSDARDSSDFGSDRRDSSDSTGSSTDLEGDYLPSDPLTSSRRADALQLQAQRGWLRRCLARRSSRYLLGCLGLVAVALAALGWGGFFAHVKHKKPPPDGESPPWYPTPRGGTTSGWADSYRKASEMVSRMSLPEKVNVTTGTGWAMGPAVGNTGPAVDVGFPSLALQDGPLGVRFADNITAFPAGVTVGATWNKDLMYEWGHAHAVEAKKKGIHVILGPTVGGLGRMPAGGRNWEGFGADPYLQGVAAAESVRGIQDEGVMATIKHLVANEQEHFRQENEWGIANAISSNIDDRTLHELYLWPFGDAIKEGVASVMCSYNMLNNSYACGNSKLLNGILRDEMGFQGFVMSDWLAQRGGVSSALAGLDMTMPGDGLFWSDGKSLWGPELTKAVLNSSLPLDRLNDMVTRIVAAWYQLGQDEEDIEPNFSSWTDEEYGVYAPGSPTEQELEKVNHFVKATNRNHSSLARQIAAEGHVLLKNDDVLPLPRDGSWPADVRSSSEGPLRVAIFGEDAGPGKGPNHCIDRQCNQGTLAMGWGSGSVEFPYLVTPAEALTDAWDAKRVNMSTHLTNDPPPIEMLNDADVCIVFANADSGEGFNGWANVKGDRPDLHLQKGGEELVEEVAYGCHGGDGATIVVVHNVGPVVMESWIDLPNVKAVLLGMLPGQESGNALADVITGDVNPSGKLPWTIGKSLADYGEGGQVMYKPNGVVPQQDFDEGLYIDYRHFDKYNIEPRYEFGYGLSYTTFEFSDPVVESVQPKSAWPAPRPDDYAAPPEYSTAIPDPEEALFPSDLRRLEKYVYPYIDSVDEVVPGPYPYPDGYDERQPSSDAGGDEGGNPDLWQVYATVSVDVTNTGDRAGQAVAELYLAYPESSEVDVDFPVKVLRGFDKTGPLAPRENQTVTFELTRRDLSYWDVEAQNWRMPEEGKYQMMVGHSSRDLPAKAFW
ncbi:glycoside hydrolase superfamily [Xylariaceae sp. FL0804]|nr:glycoside hydrolase superfamily [Xylariaceae sp. FL0804]